MQPFILAGLPLALIPVVIHFLNRMRHRPKPWAAMRFLASASRSSTSHAKLRQFLILLCRVLSVALLVLFVARPLAGGWLGWALSPAPDAIVILLDRSASMEARTGGTTKREQAMRFLAQAAKEFEESSHLVLIDSAARQAQEFTRAASLPQLDAAQASDTAADIPALLRSAFDWLADNRAGAAEIWIASDGQRSNWLPEDPRWKGVTAQLGGLSRKTRIRLLSLDQPGEANASVAIKEVARRARGSQGELRLTADLRRNRNAAETIPLTLDLDGARSEMEAAMEGASLRWRRNLDLGARNEGGWGSLTLPADGNEADNTAYFVYGADTALRAVVVSDDAATGRFLQFAAGARDGQPAARIAGADFAGADLKGCALVIWQRPLPDGAEAERLQSFVAEGGVAAFFPPGQPDGRQFAGLGWGSVEEPADKGQGFRVLRWNEEEGPLARSDEHFSLPLPETAFQRRQTISGRKDALAAFDDGAAFLAERTLGQGGVYFCASLPNDAWSSLADGPVLVPMLQRLMEQGGQRLQQVSSIACGELSAVDQTRAWTRVDAPGRADIRTQAGVYRSGDRLVAVNRPVAEDDPEAVSATDIRKLFGDIPFQMMQERREPFGQTQGEIWRVFLFAMLLLLIAEAVLILPSRSGAARTLTARSQPIAGPASPAAR